MSGPSFIVSSSIKRNTTIKSILYKIYRNYSFKHDVQSSLPFLGAHFCDMNSPIIINNRRFIHTGRNQWNRFNLHSSACHFSSFDKKKDLYDILDVSQSASSAEIKKAYFNLAKKYHPDVNKDDTFVVEKFKEITYAYEILSDQSKREVYDSLGHEGLEMDEEDGNGSAVVSHGTFRSDGYYYPVIYDDMLDEMIQQKFSGEKKKPRPGADINIPITISFFESVFGCKKTVTVDYTETENGKEKSVNREILVEIPAGIDHGEVVKLKGQGQHGDPNTQKGDLIVVVSVKEDAYFKKKKHIYILMLQ